MKKNVALLLAPLVILALAACEIDSDDGSSGASAPVEVSVGDQSESSEANVPDVKVSIPPCGGCVEDEGEEPSGGTSSDINFGDATRVASTTAPTWFEEDGYNADAPAALATLDTLTVADRVDNDDYDRDSQFGDWERASVELGWPEALTGCYVNDAVLFSNGIDMEWLEQDSCIWDEDKSYWVDPYGHEIKSGDSSSSDAGRQCGDEEDGRKYSQCGNEGDIVFVASRDGNTTFDIEHIVPLKEVWLSGGSGLSAEQRTAIANDPLNLTIALDSENQSKGNKGTDAWLPDSDAYLCEYVSRYVDVKSKYGLTITLDEKQVMASVLTEDC